MPFPALFCTGLTLEILGAIEETQQPLERGASDSPGDQPDSTAPRQRPNTATTTNAQSGPSELTDTHRTISQDIPRTSDHFEYPGDPNVHPKSKSAYDAPFLFDLKKPDDEIKPAEVSSEIQQELDKHDGYLPHDFIVEHALSGLLNESEFEAIWGRIDPHARISHKTLKPLKKDSANTHLKNWFEREFMEARPRVYEAWATCNKYRYPENSKMIINPTRARRVMALVEKGKELGEDASDQRRQYLTRAQGMIEEWRVEHQRCGRPSGERLILGTYLTTKGYLRGPVPATTFQYPNERGEGSSSGS